MTPTSITNIEKMSTVIERMQEASDENDMAVQAEVMHA